ncbi:EAL domain-containing protein [Photobacterium sp. SDRW27]|uniref:bifunctional diguanylate cyclase/phosphodiesterase n=1 Tax=Photobacterium obscurum TaxID=2829490 RepID=UPI002244AEFD|nr:GGDEF and EAL domain-containing protein [Photobacterium obscurum]MCW8331082.1 EAL domain-containing protein [Photobacterium obscurum]
MLKPRLLTLRFAVMMPFSLLLLLTVGVIAIAQQNSYERMLAEVSGKLLNSYTRSISNDLRGFLGDPFNTNLTIADSIQRHNLYQPPRLAGLEAYLKDAISTLYAHQPQITTIGFGSEDKYFVGFRKRNRYQLSLLLKDRRTDNELHIYNESTHYSTTRYRVSDYDPTERPWYLPFARSLESGWADVYTNQDENQSLAISAVSPVIDDTTNQLLGVMVTDISLSHLNKFLRHESNNFSGSTYLIDGKGKLLASSGLPPEEQPTTHLPQPDPLIEASQAFITEHHMSQPNSATEFAFEQNSTRYFSRITPFRDEHGLNWSIIVIMPEAELLGQLPEQQKSGLIAAALLAGFGLLFGLFILKRLTQPIIDIAQASQKITESNWDVDIHQTLKLHETDQLASAFKAMSARLQHSFNTLRKQVLYDGLTGLLSREGLIEATRHPLTGQQSALMIIGLKAFSHINDSIGHLNGDQLLVLIARRLEKELPGTAALLSRVGRDEFAVFIPNLSARDDAHHITQQLLTPFYLPFIVNGVDVMVSASIGIVQGALQEGDMSEWLRNASLALNQAKAHEDQPAHYFAPHMLEASLEKTRLAAELNRALEHNELEVHFQPLVDLSDESICGAEALVRWRSPTRGLVPPAQFIPLAEENGMIIEMGQKILLQACLQTQQMIERGRWPQDFMLHVNLSVRQLLQANFVDQLRATLAQSALPTANLTLEITESRLISHPQQATKTLKQLRQLGVHIAIDDFGTGYSSMAYLTQLPFDSLKIDRSFVNQMSESDNYTPVVAAIITLANNFNADIVAEGVETQEQVQQLKSLGCRYAQGFYYARPKPLSEWSTDPVSIDAISPAMDN